MGASFLRHPFNMIMRRWQKIRVGVAGEGLSTRAAVQGRESWPTPSSGHCGRDNLGSNPSVGILEQTWNWLAKAGCITFARVCKKPHERSLLLGFEPMTSLSRCSAN